MDGDSEIAYIIEQLKDDQSYDEDKVVLGAQSEEEAVDMYLKHLPGYMFGDIREVPIEKLVNALYGEPEDRHGQEDLIPSEEKKAEQTKKSFKMSAGLKYMAGKKSGEKVGLFIPLPPELAKQYPIKGRAGEDDSDPHMTLLYIGDVPEGQFDRLEQIVREELVRTGPFEIELLPPDEFTNQHDQRILHSPIKSEFLTGLHDVIKQRLLDDGFKLKNPDRPFKGHVTIEYVDPGEESKFDNVNPSGSWIVNEIEIWGMGDPRIIKLDNAGDMQMVAMLKQAAYADMALKIINDMDNQSTMQWLAKYTDINVDIKDLSNNIVRLMLMNNKFMKEVKDQYGEIPVHKMIFPEKKIKDVGPTGTQVLHMNSQKMHKLPDGSGFFTALVGNDKEADTFDPKINKKTKSDYVGPGTSQVGGIGGPTADAPQSNYLFVYGTLRKGEPNHHFLENAKFLGAIKTMPKYELITAEDSPGLVEGGINSIIGELYQVSDECLAEVDAFEQPYERILITLEDGRDACSYVFPHTKDHWVEEAPHSDKESDIAFPGSIDDSFMKNEIDPLETRESRDISRPADQERLKYRHA
jgi:2'-5' RNA ligase